MSRRVNEELLTAYVLGELSIRERSRIGKAVQGDPELMQEVEMLKGFCNTVRSELQDEPLPTLTDSQRRVIRDRLVEGPIKERYIFKRLFEWRIMTPALCVSVLALLIFLRVPDQMFGKKDVTGVNEFTNKYDSLISNAASGSKIADSNRKTKNNKLYIHREKDFVNNVVSSLMERANRDINRQSFYNNKFRMGKFARGTRPMRLVNRETVPRYTSPHYNLENYDIIFRNKTKSVAGNALYAVPINVDIACYNNVKRLLTNNQMPPNDAVKIEELINYFDYNYPSYEDGLPFSVITEISTSPWNNKHKLMHIGFKGKTVREKVIAHLNQYSKPVITAENVKIRVEFDPDTIKAFRLIGYEGRNRTEKDIYHNCEMYANELYAEQTGTILYELIPATSRDGLKSDKVMTLKFGYKLPGKDQWHIFIYPVREKYVPFDETSNNFRFSAAVAGFGMLLKNSGHNKNLSYGDVVNIARKSVGNDEKGSRAKFVKLVETAEILDERY